MKIGQFDFLFPLFTLVFLCLTLAPHSAVADSSKPPIAVVVEGEKHQVQKMSASGQEFLKGLLKKLGVTRGSPATAEDDAWCSGELCYCVGSETECLRLMVLSCRRPPGMVCGPISGGEWGCSCLRRNLRSEGRDPFRVEFIYP